MLEMTKAQSGQIEPQRPTHDIPKPADESMISW